MRMFVAALCLAALAGCGDGSPPTYPVTGKLVIDGKPASGITVLLSPVEKKIGTPTSSGITGADGTFKLTTSTGKPGAAKGKYKVVLMIDNSGQFSALSPSGGTGAAPAGGASSPATGTGANQIPESMRKAMEQSGAVQAQMQQGGVPETKYPFPKDWTLPESSPKEYTVSEKNEPLDISI